MLKKINHFKKRIKIQALNPSNEDTSEFGHEFNWKNIIFYREPDLKNDFS